MCWQSTNTNPGLAREIIYIRDPQKDPQSSCTETQQQPAPTLWIQLNFIAENSVSPTLYPKSATKAMVKKHYIDRNNRYNSEELSSESSEFVGILGANLKQ